MKIFLSYGHDDNAELVKKIKARLEELHSEYSIWFDQNNIHAGDDWRHSICTGLSESNAVLACLSKHSVRVPGVCLDELRIAAGERTCEIVSVLLEAPEEVSPPLSISHIQYLDMSAWREKQAQGSEVFDPWFEEKVQQLDAALSKGKGLAGEVLALKEKLQANLSSGSYIDRIRYLLKDGFVGREWIFKEIQDWLESEPTEKVFCITGEPGIGKSALVAQFAAQNKVQIGGIHFCFSGSNFDTPRNIILSLAFQMGTRLPAYRKYLLETDIDFDKASDADLFQQLICRAGVFTIDGGQQPYLLVVDALDEADGALAKFIAQHKDEVPRWLYFLVTSRPNDKHVKPHLAALSPRTLSASDKRNTEDAQAYIKAWLQDMELSDTDRVILADRLLTASSGNFRYLTFLRDMVKSGTMQLSELMDSPDTFPTAMSSLYDSFMERIYPDEDKFNDIAAPIIGAIACGHGPLSKKLLFAVMEDYYDLSEKKVTDCLNLLGSLLRQDATTVQFYHRTVEDWFLDESNTRFTIDIRDASKSLIKHLIKMMIKIAGKDGKVDEEEVKKVLAFAKDGYALLLGRLLFDRLMPGNGLTPDRLDNFREEELEKLGIDADKWHLIENDFLELALCSTNDDFDYRDFKDVDQYWSLLVWRVGVHFDGEEAPHCIARMENVWDVFDEDEYPDWSLDFAKKYHHLAEKIYKKDDEEYIDAIKGILFRYYALSQDKERIQIAEENLPVFKKKSGSISEDMAYLYGQLADAWDSLATGAQDNPLEYEEKADFYHKKRIKTLEKLHGKDSFEMCEPLCDYATYQVKKNDCKKAIKYYQMVEKILNNTVNEENPPAFFYSGYAEALAQVGDFESALGYRKKNIEQSITDYGYKSSHTGLAYSQLADLYNDMDKTSEAFQCYQKAIKILDSVYARINGLTIYTYENFIDILMSQDKFDEALKQSEALLAAVQADRKNLDNGINLYAAWEKVQTCKKSINQSSDEERRISAKKLLEEEVQAYGKYDERTLKLYQSISYSGIIDGLIIDNNGENCREYLDIAQHLHGEESLSYIEALLILGYNLVKQENNAKEAIVILEKGIALMEKIIGIPKNSIPVFLQNLSIHHSNWRLLMLIS